MLLQHGLEDSAWTWVSNDPRRSFGFKLYELGYDVWMGNNRGNMFSSNHTHLKRTDKAFWQFSFSDLGRHDLPANIDYILNHTGQKNLTYVGHSQGTSQFFSAMVDPNATAAIDKKVNLFIALAPVTYLKHVKNLLYRTLGDLDGGAALEILYPYGFLEFDQVPAIDTELCLVTLGAVCKVTPQSLAGTGKDDDKDALVNLTAHFPAGSNVQSVNHYEQLYRSGNFQDYDFGKELNLRKYGTVKPPLFNLSKAAVPIALFMGSEDELSTTTDNKRMVQELPVDQVVYQQEFKGFAHMTYSVGGSKAWQQWYPDALQLMGQYNPLPSSTPSLMV